MSIGYINAYVILLNSPLAQGIACARLPVIRTRLSQTLNGHPNITTLYSTVDVLTSTHIIVIRELAQWAEGLGMLQAFST